MIQTVVTDCHQHSISENFPLDATAFQIVRKNIAVVWGAVFGISEDEISDFGTN